ncbi:MAG: MFS transporter [Leptotrichiaceae bacterium]|nr:MFS transporter [Leptotrichiaceae bacterium]
MKHFLKLWIGELISNIGSGMTSFALSAYIYEKTGRVSYVSLIMLLAYVPNIILSPVGGILADRYDRRILMIIGDFLSGLGIAYIFWNIQTGNESLFPIFIGIGFSSVFTAVLEPSYKATVTDVLPKREYDRASGLVQMAENAKYLIAPALAGFILSMTDIRVILLFDIMTFIITCFIIVSVKKYIGRTDSCSGDNFIYLMKEGISVIIRNKGIYFLVNIMFFVCFFIGMVQVLLRPLILSLSSIKTAGIMESVCAFGMLGGSLRISFKGIRKKYAEILSVAGILCGIFMSASGISTNLLIIGIFTFLFFMTLPFMNTCADVLVRISVPDNLQGRIWGIISFLTQAGSVTAFLISGILADYVFEPMFSDNGILSDNIGMLIGIGKGRGTGFLLVLSGLGMIAMSVIIGKNKEIKVIENKKTG